MCTPAQLTCLPRSPILLEASECTRNMTAWAERSGNTMARGNLTLQLQYSPSGSTTITNSVGITQTHNYDARNILTGAFD